MSYIVNRLCRPYDFRVLIEAYIYTKRDYVHPDFKVYYSGLFEALERLFAIRLSRNSLSFTAQKVFWMHFEATVRSVLQITSPWAGYLEDSLLNVKLAENEETAKAVYRAGELIDQANKASNSAHREILYALFVAIFGECHRVVSSAELKDAGFDDAKEPGMTDYWEFC